MGIFLLLGLACLLFALSAYYAPASATLMPDRAQELASYQKRVFYLNEILASGQLTPNETEAVNGEIHLLDFYLSSGTIAEDYVKTSGLSSLGSPYQGTAFAFKNIEAAFAFMSLFVPFSFYRYVFSHGALGSKNFAMAPLEKKKAFASNFLFSLLLISLPFLFFFLVSGLGIAWGGNSLILYEKDGVYHAFRAGFLLLSLFLSLSVYVGLLLGVCFLAALLFHQDYIALFSPLLLTLLILALFSIINLSSPTLSALEENDLASYFPLLSLYHLAFYPTAFPYWVSWVVHALFALGLFFLCYRHYAKEGYSL